MDTNRRIAVVAGVAFIIATLTQVVGVVLVSPILAAPDYLTRISANEGRVALGALFQFIGAVACTGIALALYPVLRKHNVGLALGSVGFRAIEGTLHILIAVCLLLLVTLSQESAKAVLPGSPAFQVPGALLLAGRYWLAPVSVLTFGIGALMYYWVLYRSRLVPRWLSVWGLVAILSVMVSAVLVMLQVIENFSANQLILALPIGVQEMVLAIWLILKGFDPVAVAAESSSETSRWRTTASQASGSAG